MRSRVNRLNGGSRYVNFDSFTGPTSEQLVFHGSESGKVWTPTNTLIDPETGPVIDANARIKATDAAQSYNMTHGRRRLRRNGSVSADIIKIGVVADASFTGVIALAGHGGRTYIYTRQNHATGNWTILRRTWGQSEVAIASATQALTQDQVYRMRMEIRKAICLLWVDGVLLIRADVTSVLSAGGWGLRVANNVASVPQARLDNWMTTR